MRVQNPDLSTSIWLFKKCLHLVDVPNHHDHKCYRTHLAKLTHLSAQLYYEAEEEASGNAVHPLCSEPREAV